MTIKSMTDFHYNCIFHDQQNAVKKRDLMFAGLYLDQLKSDGFTLPLKNLYQKYPQVEVYTSNLETAQSLIESNIENMLIYLLGIANLKMDENAKFVLFYIPEENTESNAFNSVRKMGSTTFYSTFLFSNWLESSVPQSRLFKTLVNEIVCDWWGSERPEIVMSGEYQQYTAAFTAFIGEALRIYIEKFPDLSIDIWSVEDFYKVFEAIDAHILNGGIDHKKIYKMLSNNYTNYDYSDHKKLYKIDNQDYKQVRIARLVEELQNMKTKLSFKSFDYSASENGFIDIVFKEAEI